MDQLFRLGQFAPEQDKFFDAYCSEQEIDRAKILNLAASLAGISYLSEVGMQFYGGIISGAQVGIVAKMVDVQFSSEMAEIQSLNGEQRNQRGLARAVRAYERLEEVLARPGLFEHVDLREVPIGHPLENRTELDHYALQARVTLGRKEGTHYKGDFLLPVELSVQGN